MYWDLHLGMAVWVDAKVETVLVLQSWTMYTNGCDFTQKWSSIITMKTVTLISWVWLNYLITNRLKMLKASITDGVPMCACAIQLFVLSLGFRQSHHPPTKIHCNHGNLVVKSLINPTLAQPWWKDWSEVTHKPCCMVIVVTSVCNHKNWNVTQSLKHKPRVLLYINYITSAIQM